MTTLHLRESISRSPLQRGLLFIALALCCFALSPAPNAFGVSPPPDGDYAGANTAEGDDALFSLTTGIYNTANGYQALNSNTSGSSNTATGFLALTSNTTGFYNTANGDSALLFNTSGHSNTATGFGALYNNRTINGVSGHNNTATGFQALFNNRTGTNNTANGLNALNRNTTGGDNTANGTGALFFNTTGTDNTANGFQALEKNTTGNDNAANGFQALFSNTTGPDNTANGFQALFNNRTGGGNTANGFNALFSNTTGIDNVADGLNALKSNTTGSSNTALGVAAGDALTTGSNNIDIGNLVEGGAGESDTIRIGRVGTQTATFIAGIANATVTGSAVYIDTTSGQLGLLSSSERFKDGIEPMGNASEALLWLRPVTFRYKKNIDPKGIPQFGLVAEEVEKVNPDLVVRDAEGKVFTVRYEAVNAMLLNEFLKEHKKVEDLEKDLRATIVQQQKEIEALTTGLQKVSAQLELRKPAPQTVANNQ
jgi:trimeric autotransporter adhesin